VLIDGTLTKFLLALITVRCMPILLQEKKTEIYTRISYTFRIGQKSANLL